MLRVPHNAASAAEVRHAIIADLNRQSLTRDSLDDVVLVASELVGNAVTHVNDLADLAIDWQLSDTQEGVFVIVRVCDGSSTRPQVKTVDASATSGRGLAIIAAVAAEWGVRDIADGKQVWARVPVHRVL